MTIIVNSGTGRRGLLVPCAVRPALLGAGGLAPSTLVEGHAAMGVVQSIHAGIATDVIALKRQAVDCYDDGTTLTSADSSQRRNGTVATLVV
jgi:hypothetical protein